MRKSLEQRDCCQVVRGVVIMKNKWIHFSIDRESLIGMLSGSRDSYIKCYHDYFQ